MPRVSSRSRSENYSLSEWEDSHSGEVNEESGFEGVQISEIDLDEPVYNQQSLISLANKHISIQSLLDELKIELIHTYSPSGWSLKSSCIFPDHADSSPSFFINISENIFNCFGCQRGGGPVQLLAYLHGKEPFYIAQELLKQNNIEAPIEKKASNLFDIQDILFDFADLYFNYTKSNPHKIMYAQKISMCFDFHIRNAINQQIFNKSQLQAILKWCQERLNEGAI